MYTGRRVLVVDDEPLIASLIADWLEELGCEVAGPVSSASAALQTAALAKLDAAFLDVTIGDGNSFALAKQLSAQGVAVAFITGHDPSSLPAGFSSIPVLGKPFDLDAISRMLDRMLGIAR
jgi:two-component SAPR family response regulator